MTFEEDCGSRLHCVLPFDAVPDEVSLLRKVIRPTLGCWGAGHAVDEVQLVVTELATNVIKHVGERTPATLVLESRGNRLRVELHDKSGVMPTAGSPASCEAECGRGLHLLAAMSADWGAIATGTGKAVWCELPLVADAVSSQVRRASAILDNYRDILGVRAASAGLVRSRVNQEAAATLIADLLVWLTVQGDDPDDVLLRAQQLYEGAEAA